MMSQYDHFIKLFKLIKVEKVTRVAYLVPNEAIPSKATLEEYQVSIEVVEKVTGLAFEVPNMPKKTLAAKIEEAI